MVAGARRPCRSVSLVSPAGAQQPVAHPFLALGMQGRRRTASPGSFVALRQTGQGVCYGRRQAASGVAYTWPGALVTRRSWRHVGRGVEFPIGPSQRCPEAEGAGVPGRTGPRRKASSTASGMHAVRAWLSVMGFPFAQGKDACPGHFSLPNREEMDPLVPYTDLVYRCLKRFKDPLTERFGLSIICLQLMRR